MGEKDDEIRVGDRFEYSGDPTDLRGVWTVDRLEAWAEAWAAIMAMVRPGGGCWYVYPVTLRDLPWRRLPREDASSASNKEEKPGPRWEPVGVPIGSRWLRHSDKAVLTVVGGCPHNGRCGDSVSVDVPPDGAWGPHCFSREVFGYVHEITRMQDDAPPADPVPVGSRWRWKGHGRTAPFAVVALNNEINDDGFDRQIRYDDIGECSHRSGVILQHAERLPDAAPRTRPICEDPVHPYSADYGLSREDVFSGHVLPPAKCLPSCTPSQPCRTEAVCPVWREEEIARKKQGETYWWGVSRFIDQEAAKEMRRESTWRPSTSGMGAGFVGVWRLR